MQKEVDKKLLKKYNITECYVCLDRYDAKEHEKYSESVQGKQSVDEDTETHNDMNDEEQNELNGEEYNAANRLEPGFCNNDELGKSGKDRYLYGQPPKEGTPTLFPLVDENEREVKLSNVSSNPFIFVGLKFCVGEFKKYLTQSEYRAKILAKLNADSTLNMKSFNANWQYQVNEDLVRMILQTAMHGHHVQLDNQWEMINEAIEIAENQILMEKSSKVFRIKSPQRRTRPKHHSNKKKSRAPVPLNSSTKKTSGMVLGVKSPQRRTRPKRHSNKKKSRAPVPLNSSTKKTSGMVLGIKSPQRCTRPKRHSNKKKSRAPVPKKSQKPPSPLTQGLKKSVHIFSCKSSSSNEGEVSDYLTSENPTSVPNSLESSLNKAKQNLYSKVQYFFKNYGKKGNKLPATGEKNNPLNDTEYDSKKPVQSLKTTSDNNGDKHTKNKVNQKQKRKIDCMVETYKDDQKCSNMLYFYYNNLRNGENNATGQNDFDHFSDESSDIFINSEEFSNQENFGKKPCYGNNDDALVSNSNNITIDRNESYFPTISDDSVQQLKESNKISPNITIDRNEETQIRSDNSNNNNVQLEESMEKRPKLINKGKEKPYIDISDDKQLQEFEEITLNYITIDGNEGTRTRSDNSDDNIEQLEESKKN
ncbi:hypothetical protein TNCT_263591 [Trichonephila clavata]|uniref:Uncharacterized protein n=1 Tax=Trichonephila clavata TaxID=2740835 RepID=A0A8X6FFK6_TRICU|nr:hypothetical protein TNCT_263591 [Trichonephila clavata]